MVDVNGDELVAIRRKDVKALYDFIRYGLEIPIDRGFYKCAQHHGAGDVVDAIVSHQHYSADD